jgi:hypothetical protein
MTKLQISISLEIPDVQVLKSEMTKASELIITIENTKETTVCQHRGKIIRKFHGYDDWTKIRYLSVFGHPTYLRYRPKRYRCENCDGHPTTTQRLDWHEPNSPNSYDYEVFVFCRMGNLSAMRLVSRSLLSSCDLWLSTLIMPILNIFSADWHTHSGHADDIGHDCQPIRWSGCKIEQGQLGMNKASKRSAMRSISKFSSA